MSTQRDNPTTHSALIDHYRAMATELDSQPGDLSRLLATDYRFIAELLVVAIGRGTVKMLVGELRRNLNRRSAYVHSEERNAVLQEVAGTIERLENKEVAS
jgi:hypothetical protein